MSGDPVIIGPLIPGPGTGPMGGGLIPLPSTLPLNSGYVLADGLTDLNSARPVVAVRSKALTVWDSADSASSVVRLSTQAPLVAVSGVTVEAILQYQGGNGPVAIKNLAYYYGGARYILGSHLESIQTDYNDKISSLSTTTSASLVNLDNRITTEAERLENLIDTTSGDSTAEIARLDTRIDLVLTNTQPEALDSLSELINNYSGLSDSLVNALNAATSRLTLVEQALESLQAEEPPPGDP